MAHTVKGQPPEVGDRTKYETLDGEIYNKAKINSVGASSSDGLYFNVNVTWTPPEGSPETGDHVYWVSKGWVRGDPTGPPWPG